MTGGVAEVLEQQGGVLEQFNSWPAQVLERFISSVSDAMYITMGNGTSGHV